MADPRHCVKSTARMTPRIFLMYNARMAVQLRTSDKPGIAITKEIDAVPRSQRADLLWLCAGTLVVTLVMFLFGLWGSGGRLAPPLDDTFIHMQYARQLAAGHPFEYNTGDPPSSGDSAFIYPFMLAPAYLLGLDGMRPLLYADLLNLVAHLSAVVMLYKLGFLLGGRPVALLAAWFLLLDGGLNWAFVTGMETGIYTAALVAFFYYWARDVQRARYAGVALAGVLTALLRPEGHILISIACVLTMLYLWREGRLSIASLLLLLPVLAGLLPYLVNLLLTGSWQFNTAASKSIWYVPHSPLHEKLSITAGYFISALKNIYLGLEVGRSSFPLLGAPLAVIGAGAALAGSRLTPYRALHILMLTTLLGGIGLALLLPPLHFYRYNLPYNPFVWLYLAFALSWLVSHFTSTRHPSPINHQPSTQHWIAGAAVTLLILPQFVGYFFAFGDSTRDIRYQQMEFSEWLKQNTPPDARIGVNDTGAHKYLSDRYTIDLIGLTDNHLRGAYFGGWGAIYDRLVQLPEERRPTHFLIHPNVFLNGIEESAAQSFLTPIYSIRIRNPIITAGDTEVLYKVNWEYALVDPTKTYVSKEGATPLDTLNVGDPDDEERHGYGIEGRQPSLPDPKSFVTTSNYEEHDFSLTESGRRHSGWEEFTVKSEPGKPLTIVSRTRLAQDASQRVLVYANGRQVTVWEAQNEQGGRWQEYQYTVPSEFITGDKTTIRLDATFDPGGPGFLSYRYWFYAP